MNSEADKILLSNHLNGTSSALLFISVTRVVFGLDIVQIWQYFLKFDFY